MANWCWASASPCSASWRRSSALAMLSVENGGRVSVSDDIVPHHINRVTRVVPLATPFPMWCASVQKRRGHVSGPSAPSNQRKHQGVLEFCTHMRGASRGALGTVRREFRTGGRRHAEPSGQKSGIALRGLTFHSHVSVLRTWRVSTPLQKRERAHHGFHTHAWHAKLPHNESKVRVCSV